MLFFDQYNAVLTEKEVKIDYSKNKYKLNNNEDEAEDNTDVNNEDEIEDNADDNNEDNTDENDIQDDNNENETEDNDDNNENETEDNDDDNESSSKKYSLPEDNEDGTEDNTDENDIKDENNKDETEDNANDNNEDNTDENDIQDNNNEDNKLSDIEKQIFSNMTPEQIALQDKTLRSNYNDMYNEVVDIINRLKDLEKPSNNFKAFSFIERKLNEVKELIYDYMNNTYYNSTYIENNKQYQMFISILLNINLLFDRLNIEKR